MPKMSKDGQANAPHRDDHGNRCCDSVEANEQPTVRSTEERHQSKYPPLAPNSNRKVKQHSEQDSSPPSDNRIAQAMVGADPVYCSLCQRPFETQDNRTLCRHLNAHFNQLLEGHICTECNIKFVHAKDLHKHLEHARSGSCGINFCHKMQCTGHQGPMEEAGHHKIALDSDRFEFCFRLRQWEHAQLQ